MGRMELFDQNPGIKVLRNEEGDVKLRIAAEGVVLLVSVGRLLGDVEDLRDTLTRAVETLNEDILNDWVDTPESEDGYVTFDRGAYRVSLNGKAVGDRHGFPSRDVAVYELARAMTEIGYFPNAWEQRERGITEPIDGEEITRLCDERGEEMLPLDGVQYEPGDRVIERNNVLTWVVARDYGHLGVALYASGDPSIRTFVAGDERDSLTLEEEAPADNDGYVTFDHDTYHVSAEGKASYHVSLNGEAIGSFPNRDTAIYELVSAMVEIGYFSKASGKS